MAKPGTIRLSKSSDLSRQRIVGHRGQILGQYSDILGTPNNFTRAESRHLFVTPPVPVANVQFVYPGWRYSNGEQGIANQIIIGGVAELGSDPIRIQFDGASAFTLTTGMTKTSDRLPLSLAPNTVLPVRTEVIVSAGQTVPSGLQISAPGEASYASNAASQTFGTGPLSLPSGGATLDRAYGPVAMVGTPLDPATPAIALIMDSIGQGLGDDIAGDGNGNYGWVERGLWQSWRGGTPGQYRAVRAGDTLALNLPANSLRKRLMLQFCTHAVVGLGNNDVAGSSFATIASRLTQLYADLTAMDIQVSGALLSPRTTSTDSFRTPEGQTIAAGYGPGGVRDQVNAWIKSQVGILIDGVLDPNAIWEDPANPGKWRTDGSTANLFTADGTHPSAYGYAQAGALVIKPWAAALAA